MKVEFDTREVRKLVVDLGTQSPRKTNDFRKVVRDAAGALEVLWKRNARDTSGDHGPHYDNAISYDLRDSGMTAEVGPERHKRQGNMSWEYGSRNQPPHLDGNRAADDVFRVLPKRALDAAELDL